VHIGRTGGTAIKYALRSEGLAYRRQRDAAGVPETPYGKIRVHPHRFHLADVPPGDFAFFCIRDPIERFFSGFYSRLNKGQPRHYYEWSKRERTAFEAFPTPQLLVAALHADDDDERRRAMAAMRSIRHLASIERFVGTPWQLRRRLDQVVYIAAQETLNSDWEQLKSMLGLPPDVALPSEGRAAYRREGSLDTTLDDAGVKALRRWYRRDYRLIRYCMQVRTLRGWGLEPAPEEGIKRLHRQARRLWALSAVAVPPPSTHRPHWMR
jgi:hypothetical protein